MSSVELLTSKIVAEIMIKMGKVIIEGKKIPQLTRIINEPRKFRKTVIKRATTTSDKFSDIGDGGDIKIDNPRDIDTSIKSISLIPDSTFKTNGQVKIYINEVNVLEESAVGDWTDIVDFVLDFEGGKLIKGGDSVIAVIKTSSGTSALTLVVTFGD